MIEHTFIELDFEGWVEEYEPIPFKDLENEDFEFTNHMLETYGDEERCVFFMYAFFPDHVWTYYDGDFIGDGLHFVNRLGYLITKKPVEQNSYYEINLYNEDEEGEEE